MDVLAAIHAQRGATPPPRRGADTTPVVVARLLTEPGADNLCVISVGESEPLTVPAAANVYTGVTSVYVQMHDGRPVMVTAPAGQPVFVTAPPVEAPVAVAVVSARSVVAPIAPTVSGTWRAARAAWDRWNIATDVYQAGSAESGALSGLACFGDQIVNLGADSITRGVLTLVSNGAGYSASWSAAIMGATHATLPGTAPTLAATTTAVTVGGYGKDGVAVSVEVDAVSLENLRTGTWKALGLGTAGTYGGTRGTRDSRSWTLALDYVVTA